MNAAPSISRWTLAAALAVAATASGCDGSASAGGSGGERAAASTELEQPGAGGSPSSASAGAVGSLNDPERILETTFDDLKFPMEKTDAFVESMLTDLVKSRFDRRIRIRGYIYPTPRKRGLKQFVLVRDNLECCFGPGAALFDCVLVTMRGGATAEYSTYPVAVEGEFRLEPLVGRDGRTLAIYQMAADAVE